VHGNTRHGQARHGKTRGALYRAWTLMRDRCNNPRGPGYTNYGGRGIKVCQRWGSFENFAADMGPHPGQGWSLDRINNNGNYEPSNCRWATRTQQNRNSRRTRLTAENVVDIKRRAVRGRSGHERGNMLALAKEYGVCRQTIINAVTGITWECTK
jgi:hypothetical protein